MLVGIVLNYSPLSPQIEGKVGNVRVELWAKIQEGLENVPRTNGCSIGGVCCVRINKRVPAVCIGLCCLVRKAHANRLREVEHVTALIP